MTLPKEFDRAILHAYQTAIEDLMNNPNHEQTQSFQKQLTMQLRWVGKCIQKFLK